MARKGWRKYHGICSVSGCESPIKWSGLCDMHYKRQWRHGDVETVIKPKNFERSMCAVEDCEELTCASTTTLCKLHYNRLRKYGRLHNIIADRGSGTTNSAGYRILTIGGRRVYEHIVLAELALGKPLPLGVVVHHMNEDRSDNYTPFNLVVCPDQSYHRLLHDRAKKMRKGETTKRDD